MAGTKPGSESRYPFLISVPHGGLDIPVLVRDRIALTEQQLRYYCDPVTRILYDFRDRAAAYIDTGVSRMVVDLNRPPYHLAPKFPDGAVKSLTVGGEPVYRDGRFPGIDLVHRLMIDNYFPYHEAIDRMTDASGVRFAIDCHSMLPMGPPRQKDAGKKRPLVCLGNNGDSAGNPRIGILATCPSGWIGQLAGLFRKEFPGKGDVAINTPFAGGFIPVAHYWHRGVPWMQIELNRSLYESGDLQENRRPEIAMERVTELSETVWGVLSGFWDRLAR
jgi:N-formylglutamate deformylase